MEFKVFPCTPGAAASPAGAAGHPSTNPQCLEQCRAQTIPPKLMLAQGLGERGTL